MKNYNNLGDPRWIFFSIHLYRAMLLFKPHHCWNVTLDKAWTIGQRMGVRTTFIVTMERKFEDTLPVRFIFLQVSHAFSKFLAFR